MDSNKMKQNFKGLYLVLDPSMEKNELINKLKSALEGGINIVQIWNNWPAGFTSKDKVETVNSILAVTHTFNVPVLINEEYELLASTQLEGVHFDRIPENFIEIKSSLNRQLIIGITCGNDLETIEWANENAIDYLSFCSIFPSKSAGDCEIVEKETLKKAKAITSIPFFVSGGITTENLGELSEFGIAGAAVISGILSAESPKEKSQEYNQVLNKIIK